MRTLTFDKNGNVIEPPGTTVRKRVPDPAHPLQKWVGGLNGSWQPTGQALTDLIASHEADTTEVEQIRAVLEDLRNGTGTVAVRLTRCERVLVRLIREVLK